MERLSICMIINRIDFKRNIYPDFNNLFTAYFHVSLRHVTLSELKSSDRLLDSFLFCYVDFSCEFVLLIITSIFI